MDTIPLNTPAPHATLDDDPPFYSQHGEDVLAWKLFGKADGPRWFVEVGMIDGKRFSNTLALEQRGWRGICVEAHPRYIGKVVENRPGSTVVHAAISDTSGHAQPFYADPRGDLSSLQPRDEAHLKHRFGHWFQGFEVVQVPVRTLDEILYQHRAPAGFEVLSIDIEGGEPAALRGLTLETWRPRMLILEADDAAAKLALDTILKPQGYHFARMVGVNAIYTRTRRDAMRARLVRIDRAVVHTAHDSVEQRTIVPSGYETRSRYARRLLGLAA